ncbi:MAG: transposase [Muribaculaceae bacterium]|nr:transposase [Muribaculaceae bacterium]
MHTPTYQTIISYNFNCRIKNYTVRFFNKNEHVDIHYNSLPHWQQGDCVTFITCRLADSLPAEKISEYEDLKLRFEINNPKPWSSEIIDLYNSTIGDKIDYWLHQGHGSCILSNTHCRNILAETLFYNDGIRYNLYAFVIMPNHVHILFSPLDKLSSILHSLKRHSARHINAYLNRNGSLWQKESFDHLVRSKEKFEKYITYIKENTKNLRSDRYSLYISK